MVEELFESAYEEKAGAHNHFSQRQKSNQLNLKFYEWDFQNFQTKIFWGPLKFLGGFELKWLSSILKMKKKYVSMLSCRSNPSRTCNNLHF